MIQWSSVHCTQATCYNGWGEGREGKCAKMFGKSAFSRSVRSVFERCLFAKKRGEMLHKKRGRIQKTSNFLFSQFESVRERRNVFFFSGHFASCWPTLPGGIERGPDSVRVFRVFFHSPRTYRKFLAFICLHADFVFGVIWMVAACCTAAVRLCCSNSQQQQYEDGRGEGKNKLDTLDLNYSSAMRRCRREKNYCSHLEMLRRTIRL